ncbi:hypothetical protein WMF30_21180 [Sorangium sp. So ce134]
MKLPDVFDDRRHRDPFRTEGTDERIVDVDVSHELLRVHDNFPSNPVTQTMVKVLP